MDSIKTQLIDLKAKLEMALSDNQELKEMIAENYIFFSGQMDLLREHNVRISQQGVRH
jgi:hypothetical protein